MFGFHFKPPVSGDSYIISASRLCILIPLSK